MPAERVEQGEVGGFQHSVEITWLLLGLAVERPCLAQSGWAISFAQMGVLTPVFMAVTGTSSLLTAANFRTVGKNILLTADHYGCVQFNSI